MTTEIKKKVSLKDISRKTGVSVPTISQILNNKQCNFSSQATKELVKSAATEMGYTPNIGYKIMRGFKTKTVSLVISLQRVKEEEHIQELILRLMSAFDDRGYATYITTCATSAEKNIEKARELINRGVEHFVFIGSPVGHLEIERLILGEGRTIMGYCANFAQNVDSDTALGFELVVRHLLDSGRKNIRMLFNTHPNDPRFRGLSRVFPDASYDELVEKFFVFPGEAEYEEWGYARSCFLHGSRATAMAFEKRPDADALVYLSDYFALGGASWLEERGVQVGREVAVTGYNNIPAVRYGPRPITTVEHDIAGIAEAVTEKIGRPGRFNKIIKPFLRAR